LPEELYSSIRKTLNFDSTMAVVGLEEFIYQLPETLRISVTYNMHKDVFTNHPFFSNIGNRRLLSFIGQRFRPQFF
jgi:hypothetical protein